MSKTKTISVKGILFGIGFNVIASIVLSIVVAFVFSSVTGISMTNQHTYQKAFESSFYVRLVFMLGGLLIAFGMGYVAERVASAPSIMNAFICGAILVLYGGVFMYLKPDAAPRWSQIAMFVGIIPFSLSGGWFSAGRNARRNALV